MGGAVGQRRVRTEDSVWRGVLCGCEKGHRPAAPPPLALPLALTGTAAVIALCLPAWSSSFQLRRGRDEASPDFTTNFNTKPGARRTRTSFPRLASRLAGGSDAGGAERPNFFDAWRRLARFWLSCARLGFLPGGSTTKIANAPKV